MISTMSTLKQTHQSRQQNGGWQGREGWAVAKGIENDCTEDKKVELDRIKNLWRFVVGYFG